MGDLRLNFTDVSALVVDGDPYSLTLTRQILRGFGVSHQHGCRDAAEAQDFLLKTPVDLCLLEADLPDMTGFDLVRWMRRRAEETIRFVPILILTGYSQIRNVAASRDCGANALVRKPFSPRTLYDHIAWAAGSKRPYLESPRYLGPDRRFRTPEGETPHRRATDEPAEGVEPQDSETDAPLRTANR